MSAELPLDGVAVVDLSITLPGPYCTRLLQRLGAEVVQVQPPSGDPLALTAPAAYEFLSAGKTVLTLDLKSDDGRERALELLGRADVVLEGWRPGVADRLGVGYETVAASNPGVVYCSLSGYGRNSELAHRPGHDINYLAEAGALQLAAWDGLPVGDFAGAMAAALRIVAALRGREQGKRGVHLDVSLVGALSDWVAAVGGASNNGFRDVFRLPHYGAFATADGGTLTIGVAAEQHLWARLITALGRPDWAAADRAERLERSDEMQAYIAEQVAALTTDEVERRLDGVDTCWAIARGPGSPPRVSGRL